ncbi:MAG: hypothetical protein ACC707_21035 [Thiohalomonadales bacterium]
MNNKLVVVISTAQLDKARTGMMYAVNALKNNWMEDVKIVFFGPAQELINKDFELQRYLKEYQNEEENVVVCKYIADRDNTAKQAKALNMDVKYVGELVSDLIKEGYTPMVW